jgi:hypothetical protein
MLSRHVKSSTRVPLQERARLREEALVKSEAALEEDALRFDAFLKENDEKVQEAIKKAEVEVKAKQDKVRISGAAFSYVIETCMSVDS